MNKINISVIMGVYNEEAEWLKRAISSVLAQTYKDFEFIIILDNPSNEDLKKIIESEAEKDKRIKFHINDKNLGLVQTLNIGIGLSKGKYIARMDADDIAMKNRFELQVEFLENNLEVSLVGGLNEYIDENENTIPIEDKRFYKNNEIKQFLKYSNAFSHPTIMIRREVIEKIGGYRNVLYAEDYDLILNLVSSGYEVANINKVLLKYRVRDNGISLSKKKYQISISQYIQKKYKESLRGKNYSIDYIYMDKIIKNEDRKFNSKLADIHYKVISKCNSAWKRYFDIFILLLLSNKYRVYYLNKIRLNRLRRRFK